MTMVDDHDDDDDDDEKQQEEEEVERRQTNPKRLNKARSIPVLLESTIAAS